MSSIGYAPAFGPVRSTAPATPRLRLTRRGRAVVTLLVATPLAVLALAFGVGAPGATATQEAPTGSFDVVLVDSGQSLWQIAESIAPEVDPREVIADIVALNQLPSADVQPGQRLAIPTEYSD